MYRSRPPRRTLLLRGIALSFGGGALMCSLIAVRHRMQSGGESPLLWGISAAGLVIGLICLVGAFCVSDQKLNTLLDIGIAFSQRIAAAPRDVSASPIARKLIVIGGIAFLLSVAWVAQHQDSPDDDDQSAYLQTAREIHQRGGAIGLWQDLWSGRFSESNRHPLYLALLGISPTIVFGRAVTLAIAISTLVLTAWGVRQRFGSMTAGVYAILLGTNGAWLYHSPRVVCEVLLTGLAGVLWLGFVPRSPVNSGSDRLSAESSRLPARVALSAGVLAGLCYLTKGTGLLLVAGTVAAFCLCGEIKGHRRITWWNTSAFFVFCAAIVASPLLTRNTVRYGSATYNVNSYLLWVDAYESPNKLADQSTLDDARRRYFASHSVLQIAEREISGLAWEMFIFLRMLGPAPLEDARVLIGMPLLGCGLVGLLSIPRTAAYVLIAWTLLFIVVMAWYIPIAAGDRFLMPLLIPWLILAAHGSLQLVRTGVSSQHCDRELLIGWGSFAALSVAGVWMSSVLWAS